MKLDCIKKQNKQAMAQELQRYRRTSGSQGSASFSDRMHSYNEMSEIKMFSSSDIMRLTNSLSELSKFGNWRFGRFYRGYLDGTEVNIKILDAKFPQSVDEFIQELNVLKDLRHPNLAEVVGACIDARAVVYKFPDRNLEDYLKKCPRFLTWHIRTSIIYQICSALVFLYSNKPCPIIHGNLTPRYLLLDSSFNCIVLIPEGTATNPNPRGKFTEYIETGNRNLGSDVYSLGVIILRVLTGLPAQNIQSVVHDAGDWAVRNVDRIAGSWPLQLVKELAYFGSKFCKNTSGLVGEILEDLGNILVVIDEFTFNKSAQNFVHGEAMREDYGTSSTILGLESSIKRQTSNEIADIKMFSFSDIMRATNDLSDSSNIAPWRYGRLYKGNLGNIEVYIKMLDAKLLQDVDEFVQELDVLKGLRHPNLAELVGACIDFRAVVYRFPERNLEECLEKCPRFLTWQIRVLIIYQICSALMFLYSNKPRPIIHGNLTPRYILLDSSFNCTVLIPEGTATNPNPRGKFTEYIETGNRNLGSDVYSLGVVILRVLTGLPARNIQSAVHDAGDWVVRNVDRVAGSWPLQLVKELAYFGLKFCKNPSGLVGEILEDLGHILVVIDELTDKKLNEDREETKGEGSGIHSSPFNRTSRFKSFTYSEIESATNGLSESSKIGEGGYGSVYKGHIDNNDVAIKMLDANSNQGSTEFVQELDILGDVIHPHIVRLIGACFNLRALVYEFLPNGSIEDCLKKCPGVLTWQMRTRIIREICSGLIFLHSRKPKPMVHGDLKPHNILLDSNFGVKIADFGLSRFMSEGTSTATAAFHRTKNIKGTEWYIDPDFLETGMLTPGCDVYAFGVTILRILTGGPPARILRKVEHAITGKKLMTIVDSAAGDWPEEVAEYLASIGLECCEPERKCSTLLLQISNGLRDILVKIGS